MRPARTDGGSPFYGIQHVEAGEPIVGRVFRAFPARFCPVFTGEVENPEQPRNLKLIGVAVEKEGSPANEGGGRDGGPFSSGDVADLHTMQSPGGGLATGAGNRRRLHRYERSDSPPGAMEIALGGPLGNAEEVPDLPMGEAIDVV